ncbi:MAG: AMP-binding protein [Novosphingobium sp.]|nr:AMP-binding protein [Novosphingobium sp.]
MTGAGEVSFGRRLGMLAGEHPERIAAVVERPEDRAISITFAELDHQSNRAARMLEARGIGPDARVALALPNSIDWFVACFAIWKLGACVFTIRSDLPAWETDRLCEAAQPTHALGDLVRPNIPSFPRDVLADLSAFPADPMSDRIPAPYKINATGGSTGIPKIVVPNKPGIVSLDGSPQSKLLRLEKGQVQLVVGPLYHYGPSLNAISGVLDGHTVVTFERFDARAVMRAIETHRVQIGMLVPTMLYRVLELPDIESFDTSSIVRLSIAGAKCPDWVFEKAIDIFGADVLFVGYGGTENVGIASATAAEWLSHRGTTGRPVQSQFRILDPSGNVLAPGEIGEIWMRPLTGISTRYLNAEMPVTDDGFTTLGDIGWLDDDGYLYIADRRRDLIVSGGANIYPAEVEAALLQHPAVADAAVVGMIDAEWGARVHAILIAAGDPVSYEELKRHCGELLAPYKVPRSAEWRDALPRDDLGKLRRSAL